MLQPGGVRKIITLMCSLSVCPLEKVYTCMPSGCAGAASGPRDTPGAASESLAKARGSGVSWAEMVIMLGFILTYKDSYKPHEGQLRLYRGTNHVYHITLLCENPWKDLHYDFIYDDY